jgi:hypothetical protein
MHALRGGAGQGVCAEGVALARAAKPVRSTGRKAALTMKLGAGVRVRRRHIPGDPADHLRGRLWEDDNQGVFDLLSIIGM